METPKDKSISLNIDLVDLTATQCKFPTSEDPYKFCGHETVNIMHPWCKYHYKIVYPRMAVLTKSKS